MECLYFVFPFWSVNWTADSAEASVDHRCNKWATFVCCSLFATPWRMSANILAKRYAPFEHLFAPFDIAKESLYRAFGPADRLILFKRMFMADTAYAGAAKVAQQRRACAPVV